MANTYLTISMVTYKMLLVLHNMTVAAKKVNVDYKNEFARTGAKIGAQVQIRKPPVYTVTDGATFVGQDYTETQIPLIIDKHKQIGVEFLNDDLTLSMDDFTGRFLEPAMVPLANQVDVDILQNAFITAFNATGVPGTIAQSDTPFLDAKTLLLSQSADVRNIPMLVTPTVSARLSSGLAGRFNKQSSIADLYEMGKMGTALGFDFFETQNMPTFTTGAWSAATPATGLQVNAANQTGANIICKGATVSITGLGKRGDVVQFQGVYGINPITFQNTGLLANWVLTADVNSDGGGAFTLPIQGPNQAGITLTGKFQNASASPAASAQIYVWGTATVANVASQVSPQQLTFSRDGITLACVDLAMPSSDKQGVDAKRVSDPDLGLSILFMRGWDIREYSSISRLDILYGTTSPRPEHVCRVAS